MFGSYTSKNSTSDTLDTEKCYSGNDIFLYVSIFGVAMNGILCVYELTFLSTSRSLGSTSRYVYQSVGLRVDSTLYIPTNIQII